MIIVRTLDNKITEQINEADLQKYIDLGYVAVSSDEIDMIEENGTTKWKYKSEDNTKYRTLSGGSGAGLPTGGATGQVLAKASNADNDVEWVDQTGVSGVTVYADLAALEAVDTTAVTSGTLAQVVTLGQYVFNSTSTATGDNSNVITPTTGGGRWLLQSFAIEEVATSTGLSWSTTTRNSTINNRIVKTIKKDGATVRVVAIGSSVMLGQDLTNPATESYVALLAADLGANYTFFNNSIGGNTTALGYARFDKDVVRFNPDVVILGFSPNNNALAEATVQGACDFAIFSYLKYLLLMIRECENRGYDYIIMGVYPKNTYTEIANKALKSLNIKMSEMFGAKYINILGQLDDGTGKIRSGFYAADGVHFTSIAHIYMKNCIPYNLFDYLSKTKNKIELNKRNGVNLGSDTVTSYPFKTNYNSQLDRVRSWTVGVDVNLKGNSVIGKTLILFEASNSTYSVKLIVNSSNYLEFQYLGASALTTTTQLKSTGWNRIVVVFDKSTQRFKLYVDGVYINQTSMIDFSTNYVAWGGDGTATNNFINAEFRNLSRWIVPLTAEEVNADFNKIVIYGGLDEFYSLNDLRSCYLNLAVNSNKNIDLNSTTAYLATDTDNNFTDTEKTKLANSISGTFTTNDGKTITITGGMVTSIV